MSEQNQARMSSPRRPAGDAALRGSRALGAPGPGVGKKTQTAFVVVALGLLFGVGLGVLSSRSDDRAARSSPELPARPAAASREAAPPTAAKTPNNAAAGPAEQQPSNGPRYRVVVGTAYFFDVPLQSTPNGKYLRRGDTFYGEGEINGFVKTRFVGPGGTTGTGWLKAQELSKLAGGPMAPNAVPGRRPKLPAPATTPGYPDAVTTAPGSRVEAPAAASGTATAVVRLDRAYFYNSPDLATPRKAFCQRGDKVRLGESRGEAVYVTFTNWEKVTTTGWMSQDAFR